ncbi:MAG: arginase [Gammaproteobacteria bacterium]
MYQISKKQISILEYASGIAAANSGCRMGPGVLKQSAYFKNVLENFEKKGINWIWNENLSLKYSEEIEQACSTKLDAVVDLNTRLAKMTRNFSRKSEFFTLIGGDHSSAIGTWSGVASGLAEKGNIGLIWFDAHMDSHTLETSVSGNLHGMPLAALLGFGDSKLTSILNAQPKIKPEQLCLIGARSYEDPEIELLQAHQVRIFHMPEIRAKGIKAVLEEAIERVTRNTIGYGMSIDIDGLDPQDAPGTGYREPNGILAQDFYEALCSLHQDPRLLGIDLVEFNPELDENFKTEKVLSRLFSAIVLGE